MYNYFYVYAFCSKVNLLLNFTVLLVNELSSGKDILERFANADLTDSLSLEDIENRQFEEFTLLCSKAREAWALAVFSDSSKDSLERYFTYQLRLISGLYDILETLPECLQKACTCPAPGTVNQCFETEVHQLTNHLFRYFGEYPDKNITCPESYQCHIIQDLANEVAVVKQSLAVASLPGILKTTIIDCFDRMTVSDKPVPLTFGELLYFKDFLLAIKSFFNNNTCIGLTAAFTARLLEVEFNHVEIFIFLQDEISATLEGKTDSEKITLLERKAVLMSFNQRDCTERYDPRWPKLSVMLSGWLASEIRSLTELRAAEQAVYKTSTPKLKLELSVAHLACLLRLFVKEGLHGAIPLTDLFRFICDKFRTKRAETLSVGGLSKEYYSISQVTAAEVKGLLVKMINRINRDYFPVVVVISVLICAC